MFRGDIGVEVLHSCHMDIERWWFEYDGGHGSNTNFIKIDKTLLVLEISQRRPVRHEDLSERLYERGQRNMGTLNIYDKAISEGGGERGKTGQRINHSLITNFTRIMAK